MADNEGKCECPICQLTSELLDQLKEKDTETVLFAAIKVLIAKIKQLDSEREDLSSEQIIITVMDQIAAQMGMIREVGLIGPDDLPDPKKGLH